VTDGADIPRKADYGFDAGYRLPLAGIFCIAIIVAAALSRRAGPLIGACAASFFVFTGLHTSRRGKFLVWHELLDDLHLRGNERILDLGCGRGAVLVSAARRLPEGRGFGVDIWSRSDQSGNSVGAIRKNAAAEGVAPRVVPVTGNMMALPFRSNSFDVVVSSVAIHNIRSRVGRETAVDEAVRVLRPGGRLLIADLSSTVAYRRRLEGLDKANIDRRSLGWRMWWSGPWRATYLVTATKPDVGRDARSR